MKHRRILDFVSRSVFIYLCLWVFLAVFVNWKNLEERRVHYLLGIFSNRKYQDEKDGILYLEAALARQPRTPEYYAGLGFLYDRLGKERLAVWNYDSAVELAPRNEDFKKQRANVYRKISLDQNQEK